MSWKPRNSRPVAAERIKPRDLVLNSTCTTWFLISNVFVDKTDGTITLIGDEVLDVDERGRYTLGKMGQLNAVPGEKRVIGW